MHQIPGQSRILIGRRNDADCMKRVADWCVHLSHSLKSGRTKIAALALAAVCGALLLLSGSSYCIGRATPTVLRFLEPSRAPAGDEAFVAYPVESALHSTEPNDVIFLGDSVCLHGLDPAAFEKLTGLKAFNLGSFGYIGPVGYQIVARGYFLNHGHKPRAV